MYSIVKTPKLFRRFVQNVVWNFPEQKNTLFLTFDDGPNSKVTPWVLDMLDTYNAKATFFCTGQKAEKHRDLLAEIVNRDHSIGNHSYSHFNGRKTSNSIYIQDVYRAGKIIQSNLFRPPYGKIKKAQINHLINDFLIVMWDILTYDFALKGNPEKHLRKVIRSVSQGSILVFHDSRKAERNLRHMLPALLDYYNKAGFIFKAIKQ